jgi:NADPH-dependent ferric siderophore reductase
MSIIVTPRRAQRVSHEIQRREVQVRRVESPSPGFRRIVFGGDSLAGFVSLSFDDHLKFIFDDAAGQPQRRDYTPRRYDAANSLQCDAMARLCRTSSGPSARRSVRTILEARQ